MKISLFQRSVRGAGVVLVLATMLCPQLGHSVVYYRRGERIQHTSAPQSLPNRYQYAQPGYRSRAGVDVPECRPHGQARCLGPNGKKSTFGQNRFQNPKRVPPVHPYLKNLHMYQAGYRAGQNF